MWAALQSVAADVRAVATGGVLGIAIILSACAVLALIERRHP